MDIKDLNIVGVKLKSLKTWPDDRGFFREIIRVSDPFFTDENAIKEGENSAPFFQWSHSKMAKNTVKAWHFHHRQVDWWYVARGIVEVVLFDNREESPTYKSKIDFVMGDPDHLPEGLSSCRDEQLRKDDVNCSVVKIPQGVLHGCKVLSEEAELFYITSQIYNPNDEGRIPFNSELVSHNWGEESDLIIAEKDRNLFIPTQPRVLL